MVPITSTLQSLIVEAVFAADRDIDADGFSLTAESFRKAAAKCRADFEGIKSDLKQASKGTQNSSASTLYL